jgi:hypothetical protein
VTGYDYIGPQSQRAVPHTEAVFGAPVGPREEFYKIKKLKQWDEQDMEEKKLVRRSRELTSEV